MPTYRITINGNDYTAAVPNPHERPVRVIVNGKTIEVNVENDSTAAESIASTSSSPSTSDMRESVGHHYLESL